MKIRIAMNQAVLDKWNVPNLKNGEILEARESDDGFAYLLVDHAYAPKFWFAIPKSFAEVLE